MKVLIFLVTISLARSVLCQPQWGNLTPGPYTIGYKTIVSADYTRHYFEAGRPIQIYVWYPAKAGGEEMQYGDYFADAGKDWGLTADTTVLGKRILDEFKSSTLNPSFPGEIPDEQLEKILKASIPVRRNVPSATGPFPVLLHQHASGVLHQSVLMEYLASYGYVVMSVSGYGSSPAYYGRGEGSPNELLNQTLDLAFMLTEARKMASADVSRVAMVGMMAQAGLSLQMKERNLQAIACLDCFWGPDFLEKMPFYDSRAARIPILEMINTDFSNQEGSYLDSLHFADRYLVRFKKYPHADFYPFPKIAQPDQSGLHTNYELSATITRHFLDATLKSDPGSAKYMQSLVSGEHAIAEVQSVKRLLPAPPMPTSHEFLTWLRYGDMEKARRAWKLFGKELLSRDQLFTSVLFLARGNEPQSFEVFEMYVSAFPDGPRNAFLYGHVGSAFLKAGKTREAIEVFRQWTQQFPDSPQGYIALGDALLEADLRKEAQENFKVAASLLATSNLSTAEKERLELELDEKLKKLN